MSNSKVLIISTGALMIYHHRCELIERLIRGGYKVAVAAPIDADADRLREIGCELINISFNKRGKNPFKDLSFCFKLVQLIKSEHPEVVLTFYTKTNIYGSIAARITHTPYITNVTGMGTAIENGGMLQRLMMFLYKIAVADASCIFFQNEYNFNFFKKFGIKMNKARLIPGSGVSLERHRPIPYPDKTEKCTFLFISRILKEKGIDQYIDAAKVITHKYPGTVFNVIGPCDDDYSEELKLLDNQGIIHYYGKQFDIHPYIRQCHCIVFPSYYSEGMANVLLEGAACARPLITTGRPGCGETVENGITGLIVRERDSADLIEKIEDFMSLPYEKKLEMGLAGRKKMELEFDRNIVVNAYMEELAKIK